MSFIDGVALASVGRKPYPFTAELEFRGAVVLSEAEVRAAVDAGAYLDLTTIALTQFTALGRRRSWPHFAGSPRRCRTTTSLRAEGGRSGAQVEAGHAGGPTSARQRARLPAEAFAGGKSQQLRAKRVSTRWSTSLPDVQT